MRIDRLLCEEIEKEFGEIEKLEVGSEKHRAAVDSLTKLVDRAIEIDRMEAEMQEKIESRVSDAEFKVQTAKDDKINRIVSHSINVVGIILPIAVTIWGTKASFEFEKDGTISTLMGRGFINKLLPKLK